MYTFISQQNFIGQPADKVRDGNREQRTQNDSGDAGNEYQPMLFQKRQEFQKAFPISRSNQSFIIKIYKLSLSRYGVKDKSALLA